jgi:hypothetical protein
VAFEFRRRGDGRWIGGACRVRIGRFAMTKTFFFSSSSHCWCCCACTYLSHSVAIDPSYAIPVCGLVDLAARKENLGRERRGEAVELGAPRPNGVIHSILFYHRFTIHMGGRLVTCWLPADEDRTKGSCLLERLVITGRRARAGSWTRRNAATLRPRVGEWRPRGSGGGGDRATAESERDLWTCPAHVRGRWFVPVFHTPFFIFCLHRRSDLLWVRP